MRWFKHFSDNHRGRTVQRLLDDYGHSGALIYYILMELCAEKLEDRPASGDGCVFAFNRKVIVSATRCKWSTIERVLTTGADCAAWTWESNGNEVEIKMPILLNLLDRDMKKPRPTRAKSAQNPRLEEDKEKEEDKEVETDKEKEVDIVLKNNISPAVKKITALGCIDEFLDDPICVQYFTSCSVAAHKAWIEAYQDLDFIKAECRKSHAWIVTNPKKAPKNFQRFFQSWLSRGFEAYRKGIPSRRLSNSEVNAQALGDLYQRVQKGEV